MDLNNFKSLLQQIKEYKQDYFPEKIPTQLYHYCSMASFFEIIKSKKIFLSDAIYANDSYEFQLGKDLINNKIKNLSGINRQQKEILNYACYLYNRSTIDHFPFVFCLSEHGDLLSQWRGYADNASGIAIGFSTEKLINKLNVKCRWDIIPSNSKNDMSLNKLIYEPRLQELLIDLCIKTAGLDSETELTSFLKIYEENKSNIYWRLPSVNSINDISSTIIDNLLYLTKLYKNHGFKEETEWRIMCIDRRFGTNGEILSDAKYRFSNELIKPYLELDFESQKDLISSITFGPRNINDESIINNFLKFEGFNISPLMINRSETTYR